MEILGTFRPPVVSSLPAAGSVGRIVRLSTDNHIYHDNGSSWDDLLAANGSQVPTLRVQGSDFTLPANNSMIVTDEYTISSGFELTIAEGGELAIL